MKIKYILSVLSALVIFAIATTTQSGCASIVPPTGGPRDSLPPRLISVNPPDSALGFGGKKIVFEFDEYVVLDNPQQNLIISPVPKINPVTAAKLKTITMQIKDTLEPNTTYSFNFGNSIKDLNENNILRNFHFLFSTGKTLDSMRLSGKVIVAETGKTDTTLIVMLHKNLDDSAVIKDRPRYITRVDHDGNFFFRNLAPGTYAIYTLKDDGARRYLSKDQLFGFADSVVLSQSLRDDIALYAYAEKVKDKDKTTTPTTSKLPPKKTAPKKPESGLDKGMKVQSNLNNGQLELISNLTLTFSEPLRSLDTSKMQLLDEKFERVAGGYSVTRDTSNKVVTITRTWAEDTKYNLILDTTFAEDTLGKRILKLDTLAFQTKKSSDYGAVRLRFINLDLKRNPVLQFIQTDQVKFSHVFKDNQFNSKLFIPGEYEMRILYDANKNGIWDSGEFFGKHIQPEKVLPISRKMNVKANWDNEVDIRL